MSAAVVLSNVWRPSLTPDDIKSISGVSTSYFESKPIQFDPKRHLNYAPPEKVYSMNDLGYENEVGVSPVGVTTAFPLFTEEAVNIMRSEIFQKDVFDNCNFSKVAGIIKLRGYVAKYAPFTYTAWTHPESLRIISELAGMELEIMFDYEIAHVNLTLPSKEQDTIATTEQDKEEGAKAVYWHCDSYPFVCVVMLSETSGMVGGETRLQKADGSIVKVADPQRGYGTVLQGRYIRHSALRPEGGHERLTVVTSFRPKNPLVKDDSTLRTVKGGSKLNELFAQWIDYRAEAMHARVEELKKEAHNLIENNSDQLNPEKLVQRIKSFENYVHDTWSEMIVDPNYKYI